MSEQIREQVSAFLDGELPNSETELLLKRLTRDTELRESFGRYALVGEVLRGGARAHLSQDFRLRVNRAIDGEPLTAAGPRAAGANLARWWRPAAGAAVAAGVMAVAVVSFQQRADVPLLAATAVPNTAPLTARSEPPHEALSYTVPSTVAATRTVLPAARLTSYVFAHSKYSSLLGQSNMLSGLLTDADADEDEEAATGNEPALRAKGAHDGSP